MTPEEFENIRNMLEISEGATTSIRLVGIGAGAAIIRPIVNLDGKPIIVGDPQTIKLNDEVNVSSTTKISVVHESYELPTPLTTFFVMAVVSAITTYIVLHFAR